jgi:hypothetical protein
MEPVPLRMKIVEAPSDALDYALYELQLTLQPPVPASPVPASSSSSSSSSTSWNPNSPEEVSWKVLRRYSEFAALRDSLTDIPDEVQSLFPPKHALRSSKDPVTVKERLERLPRWLIAVSRDPQVTTHPLFRSFLRLDLFENELAQAFAALPASASSMPMRLEHHHDVEMAVPPPTPPPAPAAAGPPLPPLPPLPPRPRPSSPSVRLVAGQHQPGAEAEWEHDSRNLVSVPAPPHAGDEYATARSSVDLRVPSLTLPADDVVRPVQMDVAEARALSSAAARAAAESEAAADTVRRSSAQAHLVADEREAADRDTEALRRRAEEAAREAARLRGLVSSRQHDADGLKRTERARMHDLEAAVERAQELARRAKDLEAEAARKAHHALHEHERATAELIKAERAIEEGAEHESHRHIAEAAAAAARAKRFVALAAKEKAEEESAIRAAHAAAAEESEAIALLHLAEEKAANAALTRHHAQARAESLQASSARHTFAAAKASSDLDAHGRASTFSHGRAVAAETALHTTEREREGIRREFEGAGRAGAGRHTAAAMGAGEPTTQGKGVPSPTHVPHEGVTVLHRTVEGVGSSLTTTGPGAAEKMKTLQAPLPLPATSASGVHASSSPPVTATPLPGEQAPPVGKHRHP